MSDPALVRRKMGIGSLDQRMYAMEDIGSGFKRGI